MNSGLTAPSVRIDFVPSSRPTTAFNAGVVPLHFGAKDVCSDSEVTGRLYKWGHVERKIRSEMSIVSGSIILSLF